MEATKMLKQESRLTLAVVLVAATLLIAGSVAIASNTGFKINKALAVTSGTGQIGNNWTSLPYFHPYPNGQALCAALGLRSTPTQIPPATLFKVDPVTGNAPVPVSCGPTASSFTWAAGQGVRIRNTAGAGAPTSAIIVGSHNPSISLTVPTGGTGNIGNFWFAVPYHTTAVNGQDLCNSVGLNSTGAFSTRGQLLRINAATGGGAPLNCGVTASGLTLTLGEAVRLRQPVLPPVTFNPAHF
jgi:hypothetical protein